MLKKIAFAVIVASATASQLSSSKIVAAPAPALRTPKPATPATSLDTALVLRGGAMGVTKELFVKVMCASFAFFGANFFLVPKMCVAT